MTNALRLSDYPRPNVAVDLAVLTVAEDGLSVLVQRRLEEPLGLVLPGQFVRPDTTVEETVGQVLVSKLGLNAAAIKPELLRVFSAPGRDPRGWTISIAHSVTLPAAALTAANGELRPLAGPGMGLLFDHDAILVEAVDRIRARYESSPDPDGILGGPFTLLELRRLHEGVLGERLRKDAFNWRMKDQLEGLVDGNGEPITGRGVGRPAQLYRRADAPIQRWQLPRASN